MQLQGTNSAPRVWVRICKSQPATTACALWLRFRVFPVNLTPAFLFFFFFFAAPNLSFPEPRPLSSVPERCCCVSGLCCTLFCGKDNVPRCTTFWAYAASHRPNMCEIKNNFTALTTGESYSPSEFFCCSGWSITTLFRSHDLLRKLFLTLPNDASN